jgi:hypothetical protein
MFKSTAQLSTREPTMMLVLAYAKLAGVSTDELIDDKLKLPKKKNIIRLLTSTLIQFRRVTETRRRKPKRNMGISSCGPQSNIVDLPFVERTK